MVNNDSTSSPNQAAEVRNLLQESERTTANEGYYFTNMASNSYHTFRQFGLREKLFVFLAFMFAITFMWLNIFAPNSVPLTELPNTPANMIQKIDIKLKQFCDEFPHNKECYMMTSVINPVPKNPPKVHALTKKFLSKILTNDKKFTAVWTGSSNSAGHDNYYNQSYTFVVEERVADIFEKVGIEFQSINTAVGSVGHFPRPLFCQPATYGENADLLGFEFGMFGANECDQEIFIRTAIANQNNPILVNTNPGGPSHCSAEYTALYYSLKGKEKEEFLNHIIKTHNGWHPGSYFLTEHFMKEDNKTNQDIGYFSKYTKSEKEREKMRSTKKRFGLLEEEYKNFGFTNFEYSRANKDDSTSFWLSRAFECRHRHHPGALGHYLAGTQISYWLLTHLKEALTIYEVHQHAGTLEKLQEDVTKPIPMPKISEEGCELPGKMQSQCYMTTQPRLNEPLEEFITSTEWSLERWFGPDAKTCEKFGYVDIHNQIVIKDKDRPLILPFDIDAKMNENHEDGRVWVVLCGNFPQEDAIISLDENIIKGDFPSVSHHKTKILQYKITDDAPETIGKMCYALAPVHVGSHTLTFKAKKDKTFGIRMLFFV